MRPVVGVATVSVGHGRSSQQLLSSCLTYPMVKVEHWTNGDNTIAQQWLRWATVPEQSGPKSGGAAVPLSVGEYGSPSNTVSPGPRPTSVLSGILNHPTVWPQYTNVTDTQERTTVRQHRANR